MKSSVEPLEGNKVKVSVEVDETEFERAVDAAFKKIAREVRIPGFRPGKAPRRILEARLGTEAARQEALRDALPDYYSRALKDTDTDPIAQPEIEITQGADSGPVAFDAVVEIRPSVAIPGYAGLRVTAPSPEVPEVDVDAQVDRLRAQQAELGDVERPARDGDVLTIDLSGTEAGEPVDGLDLADYSYELGSESILPEVDEHLRGTKIGDILEFDAAAGERTLHLRAFVKAVKEKILPEATDEWAEEASEFDTLAELRADLRTRMAGIRRVQSQLSLRNGALDALVELVAEDAPEPLVDGEVQRRLQDMAQRLRAQGADLGQYLEATGTSAEDLLGELRISAVSAVKADLALRALADLEDVTVTDDDVDQEIDRLAAGMKQSPAQLRKALERADQMQAVRSDLRKGRALEWLVDHVEVVDPDGNPIERAALGPPDELDEPGDHAGHDHEEHV